MPFGKQPKKHPTKGICFSKMNVGAGQGTGFWYGVLLQHKGYWNREYRSDGRPKVLTVVGDGSSSTANLFVNGDLVRSATDYPTQIDQTTEYNLKIGGRHLFSEILVYEDALDSIERGVLESYLSYKWLHGFEQFQMEKNGTLRTTSIFDYETDDRNYSITVWSTDEGGLSYDKNFTISLSNVVEDMDGDGTEDHYDDDIDGDGLTNAEELIYGSDPLDVNSVNRPQCYQCNESDRCRELSNRFNHW